MESAYTPVRSKKTIKSNTRLHHKVITIGFILFVLCVGIGNVLYNNEATISELENRSLQTFPEYSLESLFSGVFFEELEAYYNDHFIGRDYLLAISHTMENFKGYHGGDEVEIVSNVSGDMAVSDEVEDDNLDAVSKDIIEETDTAQPVSSLADVNSDYQKYAYREIELFNTMTEEDSTAYSQEEQLEQMEIVDDQELEGFKVNRFLVVNDSVYEIYGYSEKSCAFYSESINTFINALKDIQDDTEENAYYSMVVPSHIEFIQSQKYRELAMSQADAINIINENLSEEVEPVNIYNNLGTHADEYLYFRSDHHWTARGAYYAYQVFAETIGDLPYQLEDFSLTTAEGFLGTLYSQTRNRNVANNPDTVEIFNPIIESDYTIYTDSGTELHWDVINMSYATKTNKYMVFISGDNPLSIINTALDNGRKILIFKDSFGNAFIPYLISHYDEIHIIDPRKFKQGAATYAVENDIHEFAFINSAVVISGNTGFAKNIRRVSY